MKHVFRDDEMPLNYDEVKGYYITPDDYSERIALVDFFDNNFIVYFSFKADLNDKEESICFGKLADFDKLVEYLDSI